MTLHPYQSEQMQDIHAAFQERLKAGSAPRSQDHFDFEYGGVKFNASGQTDPYAFGFEVCDLNRSKVEAMSPSDIRETLGLSNHKIMELMSLPAEDRFDRIEEIMVKRLRYTHAKGIVSGAIFPVRPVIFATSKQASWLNLLPPEDAQAARIRMYETGSFE
ncbi:hypothetical protein [Sulfitobacter dubius]|uniref:hypothetical protein n=1 Tax=Sulfitobacter dubius TaxID=218673 RepID=UPI0022AFF943|nr:hypothetical protein [Sulfitobacter dubius]MCZ4366631.1 hypothetical protein [Sulfitobacter dubius]